MNIGTALVLTALLLAPLTELPAAHLAQPAARHTGSTALFNGKDLTGWQGDTNVWRVRDGVIAGGSLAGNPQNEFLATRRNYRDFVLRYESKVVATGKYNSGVQFRSVRITQPPNGNCRAFTETVTILS